MKNVNWLMILGIIVGLVVGGIAVMFIESIGHTIHSPIAGSDMENPEVIKAYIDSAPVLAILMVPIAWLMGSFFGSLTSTLISRSSWRLNRFVISSLFLLISLMMLIQIPSPWYMWALAFSLIFPMGFLGTGLARIIRKT